MTLTVWSVTSDTDDGLRTTVHALERDAFDELRKRFAFSPEQQALFQQMFAAGQFEDLKDWLARELERSGCDSFSIISHTLDAARQAEDPALDAAYREAANDKYADEGRIEIDSNAVVSHGDDDGAYVAAWVWVERSDLPPPFAPSDENESSEGDDA